MSIGTRARQANKAQAGGEQRISAKHGSKTVLPDHAILTNIRMLMHPVLLIMRERHSSPAVSQSRDTSPKPHDGSIITEKPDDK